MTTTKLTRPITNRTRISPRTQRAIAFVLWLVVGRAVSGSAQLVAPVPTPIPTIPIRIQPIPTLPTSTIPTGGASSPAPLTPTPLQTRRTPELAGGGPRPLTPAASYVVAVCINTGDISARCTDDTAVEASIVLSRYVLEKYFQRLTEGQVIRTVAIGLNVSDQGRNALKFQRQLMSIERRAVTTVVAIIHAQIQSMTPFQWETGPTAAEKREVARRDEQQLETWQSEARREANAGSNWDRHESSYHFNEGAAYRQLKSISFGGWGSQ